MAGSRQPMALNEARGKGHYTKDQKERRRQGEVYASSGALSPPPEITDQRWVEMFNRWAAYMERVNKLAGVPIYGDTDSDTLAAMVLSHYRFVEYRRKESHARDIVNKQRYNSMKHKEAQTFERLMKVLKLDPASRVDFGGRPADEDDVDF